MRTIVVVSLFFGLSVQLLLDGQVHTHAVIGLICGAIALVASLAITRAGRSSRFAAVTATIAVMLIGFCVVSLSERRAAQARFNSRPLRYEAQQRIAQWDEMGMYLPDAADVAFFRQSLGVVQPELEAALSSNVKDVQQRAAYVVAEVGREARTCGPALLQRLKVEPDRVLRMYQIDALASVGFDEPEAIDELVRRYALLSSENAPRGELDTEYDEVDERIRIAAALYALSPPGNERNAYREFVTRWLLPPASTLADAERRGYQERRWHAVLALESMPGAVEAIPLLEAMLNEDDAPSWVSVHVPRVLAKLRSEGDSDTPNE